MDSMKISVTLLPIYFVYIYGKIEITLPKIKPVYVKAGDPLQLTCIQTDGSSVKWQRAPLQDLSDYTDVMMTGNQHIAVDKKFYLTSVLYLNASSVDDSGSYRCMSDLGGTAPYSVSVYVLEAASEPGLLKQSGDSVIMKCIVFTKESASVRISWYKNNLLLNDDSTKYVISSSVNVTSGESTIQVLHAGERDVGQYECLVLLQNGNNFTQTVELFSYPHVKPFTRSEVFTEGYPMDLECKAWGWPLPEVVWKKGGQSLDNRGDTRYKFANSSQAVQARLLMDSVVTDDRGHYLCEAQRLFNGSIQARNATVFVRIKGKYAAVIPLMGICVEVIILIVVIAVHERRRLKEREREEQEETENQPSRKTSVVDASASQMNPKSLRYKE